MPKAENIELSQNNFPDIDKKFENGFPDGFRPWIPGWAFKPGELKEQLPDGTYKLLTLDVSINPDDYTKKVNEGLAKEFLSDSEKETLNKRAETYYNCEIGCKRCFECKTDLDNPLMSADEMLEVVKNAKKFGLKSIKFLGPGELVHNQNLFKVLDFCENNEIELIIFTKGIIFGDEKLSQKIHNLSPEDLAEKISKYKYVSLVVGFNAFSKEIEEKRIKSKISNFTEKRNKGLENLAKAGMNENLEQSRLCLISAPILKDNIDEVFPIYKYGMERNMPTILTPTMIAGEGKNAEEIYDEFFKQEQ